MVFPLKQPFERNVLKGVEEGEVACQQPKDFPRSDEERTEFRIGDERSDRGHHERERQIDHRHSPRHPQIHICLPDMGRQKYLIEDHSRNGKEEKRQKEKEFRFHMLWINFS